MVGPRSRCPGKNRKSLTIIPRLSRYQFSVSRYFVVCTTRWPRRCTRAGTRAGRWLTLVRCASSPKLNVWGCWPGSSGSSCMPATTRTGMPLGSIRSTDSPPRVCGSGRARMPDLSASRSTSASSPARKAAPAESRSRPAPHDHARCTRVGAAQLDLVGAVLCRLKTEGPRERLGSASGRASRTPATRCRRL